MPKKYIASKIIKLVLIIIICLVLIFVNPKGIFNPLRGLFLRVSIPFQRVFYGFNEKIGETVFFLGSIAQLKTENARLIKENNSLISQIANLRQEQQENEVLRKQLDLLPRNQFNLIGADIVAQDPQGMLNWVLIDKGSDSGIEIGMVAIVSDGILVGKVTEVYSHSAKIDFLTNANSSINVLDLETGAKGIAKGEYGLGLILDMVTQTDTLNNGDSIITSGLGGDVSKGLLLGKIKEIKLSADKLFQGAIITPIVKYSNLSTLFVIKNNK